MLCVHTADNESRFVHSMRAEHVLSQWRVSTMSITDVRARLWLAILLAMCLIDVESSFLNELDAQTFNHYHKLVERTSIQYKQSKAERGTDKTLARSCAGRKRLSWGGDDKHNDNVSSRERMTAN